MRALVISGGGSKGAYAGGGSPIFNPGTRTEV